MATSTEIRTLIRTLGKDPKLVQQLIQQPSENARKELLVKKGLVKASGKGPTKDQVAKELATLIKPVGKITGGGGVSTQRVVDWVLAIATGAAGAMVAACIAE